MEIRYRLIRGRKKKIVYHSIEMNDDTEIIRYLNTCINTLIDGERLMNEILRKDPFYNSISINSVGYKYLHAGLWHT